MRQREMPVLLLLLVLAVLSGCSQWESSAAADAEVAAQRGKLVLAEEPADIVGIVELREAGVENGDVALVGQIGGVDDPWSAGEACFVIVDPAALAAHEGHDDHCDNCPFCKNKTEDSHTRAMVRFVDESGNVLKIDARKLFDLEVGQMVVISGRPSIDERGYLTLQANGLYVRR